MTRLSGLQEKVAVLNQSQSQNLPIIYMLKDKNSRFQFMTDIAAQHTGSASSSELINLTASDLKCDAADFADDLKHYDNMCMYQRSEVMLLSLIQSAMGARISLICNKPIINEKNEVEGVETWAQILPNAPGLEKIIQGYHDIISDDAGQQSPEMPFLTMREQECIFYVTKGFTFVEIAQKLLISPRTVETHITNIKNKLNVKTRAELIVRVCELGYLQINLRNPNLKPGKLQVLEMTPYDPLAEVIED